MLTAISGINWGDEGKAKMVDFLSKDYDVVVRYQGGNNTGHIVHYKDEKFVLNLLPSGIFRENVVNVMGNGMVINLKHLVEEIERLKSAGVRITPKNLKISDRAVICMPYNVAQECLEEARLADKKLGTTKRGLGPTYGDKHMKKAIHMGDIRDLCKLEDRLYSIVDWKNLELRNLYNAETYRMDDLTYYLEEYGGKLLPYICDTGAYLMDAHSQGKKIMFETQLGALRDIDYGIYPYVSASSTISAYAPIGAGVPNLKLDLSIGVMKAYSTCLGKGPFVSEYHGEKAQELCSAGGEYTIVSGTPRRVGPFDLVASKYGIRIQGAEEIALTKLDVLSYLKEIEVCVAYKLDGKTITEFPYVGDLNECKPVYKKLKGWNCDISKCRSKSDLPKEALEYITFLQDQLGVKIKYVSVGADREAYIVL